MKRPQKESGWKRAITISLFIFGVLFGYAIVRYVIFKGVEVAHVPLYILNKALAVVAVVLIGLSFVLGPLARFWPRVFVPQLHMRKYLGLLGFGSATLHGSISLLLFTPSYYPKFFSETGKLNATGELSMLFGFLSLFIFAIVAITSITTVERSMPKEQWLLVQRLGYLAFAFVLLHVVIMGYEGWLDPSGWPGGMPPITLIAAVAIVFVLLMRLAVAFFPGK